MKILFLSLSAFIFVNTANAQNFHLNLFGGAMNYQGDLQGKNYTFNQAHLAGGLGLSYDLSDHFSIRANALFGKVSADDKYGRNGVRNLNFTSSISEFQLGLEYYITPIDEHVLTPYVFASLGVFHFNPYTHDTTGNKIYLAPLSTEGQGFVDGIKEYRLTQLSIPLGGGIKMAISDNINVGVEIGFRKIFTDYLDDVSTAYIDPAVLLANRGPKAVEIAYRGNELKNSRPYPPVGQIRGNPKYNDSYYFTALTVSFRLGGGDGYGRRSQYGCPVNVR